MFCLVLCGNTIRKKIKRNKTKISLFHAVQQKRILIQKRNEKKLFVYLLMELSLYEQKIKLNDHLWSLAAYFGVEIASI